MDASTATGFGGDVWLPPPHAAAASTNAATVVDLHMVQGITRFSERGVPDAIARFR